MAGVPLTQVKWTQYFEVHKAEDPEKVKEKVIILILNINFNINFISAIGSQCPPLKLNRQETKVI